MLRLVAIVALTHAVACSESTPRQSGEPRELGGQQAGQPLAPTAMAFRADAALGDITAAQAEVASRVGDADAYASLSRAFIAAKRRTGDSIHLAYAEDALRAAETLAPRTPAVLALRGVLLAEGHQFAKLAELANALIQIAPTDSTGHLLLGDSHLERGNYAAATAAYGDAMAQFPDLRVYSRGAHVRWLHGDYEGAMEMMDAALESAGGNKEHVAWCLTDLGDMFLAAGDTKRALAAADRAAMLVPNYPPAGALRARAEHIRGNHDVARRAIDAVIAVRSNAADHFLAADIELAMGDRAAAASAEAAGLRSANHDPLPAARFLARHNREIARAVSLAEREVAERPTVFARGAHALALYRAGRHDSAAAEIALALALETPLAELHLSDALIRIARSDVEGARAAHGRAIALNAKADPILLAELETKLETLR